MRIAMRELATSFAEVARLSDEGLRRLLEVGGPIERLWAAWTLGLRGGRGGPRTPLGEPEPRARRRFVLVLYELGETAAVMALAKDDPDGGVRARACRHLVRLAQRDPTLWPVAGHGLLDEDPAVRETVVRHLPERTPVPVREVALELIADDAPEVRRAVLDRLEVWLPRLPFLPDAVERQAQRESDARLRSQLVGLLREFALRGPRT